MRILAIEDSVTTLRGGSERSYFDVLTGLQGAGHQVYLIYTQEGNLLDAYKAAGVTTLHKPISLLMRSGSKLKDLAALFRTAMSVSKIPRPDVVYVNFTEALPLAALIRLRFHVPVVCHIRIDFWGLSRQILLCGNLVRRFIVVNNKLKPTFEKVFNAPGRVSVVYNGIAIPQSFIAPQTGAANEPLRILFLGRLAPMKGVVGLVKVFSDIIKRGVRATLHLTGGYVMSYHGDYRAELAQAIDKSGTSNLITISEPVPDPIDHISKFDLLIFPSIEAETFGRTIPEAILAGTPVFARNLGMVDELMADNPQFLFDTDEQLTEKIFQFWQGQLTFDFIGSRKRMSANFNKSRMIAEVEKILTVR
jgi:glycosyltransferase involved in cell wall biosynthesis